MWKNSIGGKKKKTLKIVLVTIGAIILVGLVYQPILILNSTAKLVYNVNDENISIELTHEEAKIISDIFNLKQALVTPDTPSCGFTDKASIRFGYQTFCLACDGCNTVKYQNKYFTISQKEEETILELLESYGVFLPFL